jgi:isoleucyl-tRNA synthetase
LLTSVATKGRAPYKTVLTHGFVVDENGRKMSKSLGNIVEPETVINQYGADVLRLWVASVNYTDDIPIGKSMLAQLAEIYRKLRNTARYLLGNLYDYDPKVDQVNYDQLHDLDKFILHRLQKVIADVRTDFDRYEFFKYYQVLQNFCVVDLSSFYFDIAKDRLYTAAPKSVSRRAVQTVLAELVKALTAVLAPVTPHLAEDIWSHIPEAVKKFWQAEESVLLSDFPHPKQEFIDEKKEAFWSELIGLRTVANKALEQARSVRSIGSSLEAQVHISIQQEELAKKAQSIADQLPAFLITSQVQLLSNGKQNQTNGQTLAFIDENGIQVAVLPAAGKKCIRCWKFTTDVGNNAEHPELCADCVVAIAS